MAMYTSDGVKIAETSGGDIVLPDPEEIQELRRIADTATENAEFAKKQAESAKRDAFISKVLSIISAAVGLGSFIVAILALVLR